VVEYALGLAPKTASTNGLPFGELRGGFLTMTYTKNRSASDVIVTPEVSTDLILWQNGPGFIEEMTIAQGAAFQTNRARDLTPATSATNRFLRLKVTLP